MAQNNKHHGLLSFFQALKFSKQKISNQKGNFAQHYFFIDAMDCPTEEALIRKKLQANSKIIDLHFDLIKRTLSVKHENLVPQEIIESISKLGMQAQLIDKDQVDNFSRIEAKTKIEPAYIKWLLGLAMISALTSEIIVWLLPEKVSLSMGLAILAILVGGVKAYRKGLIALRYGHINIHALVAIATTGAILIGQWAEAAMVLVLFTIAEKIESASLNRARKTIHALLALAPEEALVKSHENGSLLDSWLLKPIDQVLIGDIVRVRPGERIPLDGKIIKGHSYLNQAPITGESIPVEKTVGDGVFAGSINQQNEIEFEVTVLSNNSVLAHILKTVESTQEKRAPMQRFVERFARIYTPVVIGLAICIAVFLLLFTHTDWAKAIYIALALLVAACPCALIISTPITIVSGIAAAARQGILIKGGLFLEQGYRLTHLALDKTGTVTQGKPKLVNQTLMGDEKYIQAIAMALALRSDHPISQAIGEALIDENLLNLNVDQFEMLPGKGISGVISGGISSGMSQTASQSSSINNNITKTFDTSVFEASIFNTSISDSQKSKNNNDEIRTKYYLGGKRLIVQLGLFTKKLDEQLQSLESQGLTTTILASQTHVLGIFGVADILKTTSTAAIRSLQSLGIQTQLLSGDSQIVVANIAKQLSINCAKGNLLPLDKAQAIELLQKENTLNLVGMVGDGVNDAPALAKADISFAMAAAGSDTAVEAADVILMDDNLMKISRFVRLSRFSNQILKQNIFLSLSFKIIVISALLIYQFGFLWLAVLADAGMSLVVIANSLRLLSANKN